MTYITRVKAFSNLPLSHLRIHCICISDRWTVKAVMNKISCTAIVDFNVPGKLKPPPVKLMAIVWQLSRKVPTGTLKKHAIEFHDPTGLLASPSVPLNTWVQTEKVVFDQGMSRKKTPAGEHPISVFFFVVLLHLCHVGGMPFGYGGA